MLEEAEGPVPISCWEAVMRRERMRRNREQLLMPEMGGGGVAGPRGLDQLFYQRPPPFPWTPNSRCLNCVC